MNGTGCPTLGFILFFVCPYNKLLSRKKMNSDVQLKHPVCKYLFARKIQKFLQIIYSLENISFGAPLSTFCLNSTPNSDHIVHSFLNFESYVPCEILSSCLLTLSPVNYK